jgi:hypothetical protein
MQQISRDTQSTLAERRHQTRAWGWLGSALNAAPERIAMLTHTTMAPPLSFARSWRVWCTRRWRGGR